MHDHFGSDKTVVAHMFHERVMRMRRQKLVLEPRCKTMLERTPENMKALSSGDDVKCLNLAVAQHELQETIALQLGLIFKFKKVNGRFIHTLCDGELLARLGLTSEMVVGKELSHFYPAEFVKRKEEYYERAWQGEEVTYESSEINGVTYFARLRPIFRCGEVAEVIGSGVDITELKRTEAELRETKEQLESFINSTADAIAWISLDGKVQRVNKAFCHIFNWTAEELNANILQYIPERLFGEAVEMYAKVGLGGKVIGHETHRRRKDGELIDVSITLSPIHNAKGEVVGISAITRDITVRKKTEDLIRNSDKLSVIGQLAAGVAHEIRNPLTALKGFTQLLQSDEHNNKLYIDIMLSELERINSIVSELLLLAKPQVTLQREHNLLTILEKVITLLETQAIIHNVQLVTEFDTGMPLLKCVEYQLKQVFINLVKNAIEAMPHGGTVTVKAGWFDDRHVSVRCIDQGSGIPLATLERLGEPFYTTKERGTGLGLMVSYKIIEDHGGRIHIESEERKGTTVEVILPIDKV
ncbi:PAS domain S-box protein [Brevibacillus sp. B_LB10_24]|uniref:PAS domain-containing sensor histidine kinase n=1 Tax=Brevibacillus sp. B_LB10_24 TaxID=3380645 RepID=UPI0038B79533